jgi:hypothetical protein
MTCRGAAHPRGKASVEDEGGSGAAGGRGKWRAIAGVEENGEEWPSSAMAVVAHG